MVLITFGSAESIPARPWPAERVEFWSIERLIPYGANARLHSETDIDKDSRIDPQMGVDEPGPIPDFSYRVRFRAAMTCATAEPIEENGGCGLDRRVTTFASPYGRNGPPGGLRGLFGRRFLVRQAVAAAASAA